MEIRKAQPDDAKSIVEIHVNTWKTSYRGLIDDDILDKRNVSEDKIEKMKTAIAKDIVWVIEHNDKIIGFAGLNDVIKETKTEIEIFYMLPEYQGKGCGGQLLSTIIEQLKSQNVEKLIVWTMKNAPSLKFYQKHNGTLTGNEKIWKYNVPIVELEWTL